MLSVKKIQFLIDNSKKLSTFKSKSDSPYQVIDESNLWTLIANNKQINSEINPRIQSQIAHGSPEST